MDKKIVLVGGGGHCKSVLDSLWRACPGAEPVIVDASLPAGSEVLGAKVVGGDEVLPALFGAGCRQAFVTIGSILSTAPRRKVAEALKALGFAFPNIVDPSAVVSPFAAHGQGIFIGKNAVVNAGASVGDHAIVNTAAVIEHDSAVGAFAHVSVGAVLCGNVHVANDAFIGAGAVVIQGRSVGERAVIGAGCTVKKNVGAGVLVPALLVPEENQ